MPAYRFEAVHANGQTQKGTMEADSPRAARQQLRTQGLVPLSVEAIAHAHAEGAAHAALPWWQRPIGKPSPAFSNSQRTVWMGQLAGLVGSGLVVERALAALADECPNEKQRHVMAAVRAEVNAGSSLASAMALFPAEFPVTDRAVIAAGEQGGQLGAVLTRLATDLEAQQQLRDKLLAAALYPAIVTLVALAIVVFLLTSVVPQVAAVFSGSQRQLPWLTVAMLALSHFVSSYGVWVLALAVLGAAGGRMALRQHALRLRWDAAWLRLPIVGSLARGYNAARFAATLSMLCSAGVPILKSLHTAADTLHNQAMRDDALAALVQVREGAPLAMALGRYPRFPGLLTLFARLGEQTGQLPTMLQRAAEQLSREVQRRAMALATVLEPLLIVLMGAVVMVIVLAVLMPIMELNQSVR